MFHRIWEAVWVLLTIQQLGFSVRSDVVNPTRNKPGITPNRMALQGSRLERAKDPYKPAIGTGSRD